MVDAAWSETALRNLESAPFAEKNVVRWYADIGEFDLSRPIRDTIEAEDGKRTYHFDTRRIHRHEDHRLPAVAVGIAGIRLAHEDADFASRIRGVGGCTIYAR